MSLSNENPATTWLGTTWEKIEGKFLLGSNSSYALGSTGGNSNVKLTKANLPAEKLQIDSFQLGKGTQEITGSFNPGLNYQYINAKGAFTSTANNSHENSEWNSGAVINFQASRTWTGMSTSASPSTQNMGNGTPLNVMPPYLAINIWKRLT